MNSKKSTLDKKTKKVLMIVLAVLVTAMGLILHNAFFTFERKFTVLYNNQFNFCYLISNDYTFEVQPDRVIYRGKKNEGVITLQNSGFSEDIFVTEKKLNQFEFGYKKIKNFRIREYKVTEDLIIKDTFEMIEKTPEPLVPEKTRCQAFLKHYPRKVEIF